MKRASPLALLLLGGCAVAPTTVPSPAAPRPRAHRPPPLIAPVPTRSLLESIDADPDLATFATLVHAGRLEGLLTAAGPITVFAPSNAAWARLAPGTAEALALPGNRPSLRKLLGFLIVPGAVPGRDLRERAANGPTRLATSEGEALSLSLAGDALQLGDGRGNRSYPVREAMTTNGVLHVVNGVLVPAALG